jgi:hypothetical protein
MSILTESFEVWLPMPGQDPAVPVAQKRYYLFRTFTNQDDAFNSLRDASGAAVIKVTVPQGTRTVVARPT